MILGIENRWKIDPFGGRNPKSHSIRRVLGKKMKNEKNLSSEKFISKSLTLEKNFSKIFLRFFADLFFRSHVSHKPPFKFILGNVIVPLKKK